MSSTPAPPPAGDARRRFWRYAQALGPKGKFVGYLIADLFSASLEMVH